MQNISLSERYWKYIYHSSSEIGQKTEPFAPLLVLFKHILSDNSFEMIPCHVKELTVINKLKNFWVRKGLLLQKMVKNMMGVNKGSYWSLGREDLSLWKRLKARSLVLKYFMKGMNWLLKNMQIISSPFLDLRRVLIDENIMIGAQLTISKHSQLISFRDKIFFIQRKFI